MTTSRRTLLANGLSGAATLGGVSVGAPLLAKSGGKGRRPNVLFILVDDLGYADPGCYGSRHINTPHIDRLAAQGVKMLDAYANSPVCSPTRLALMTGRYNVAFRTGLVEPFSAGPWGDSAIPDGYPTLPKMMRKIGYRTSLIGKWHLGDVPRASPLEHGYDEFFGFLHGGIDYFTHEYLGQHDLRRGEHPVRETGYMTDLLADEAIAALDRHSKSDDPFFLSLHFNAPHWPWEGPEDAELGSHGAHHDGGSLKVFATMVESLDANIGRVMKTLDDLGLSDDTLVIFTSDNGGERFSDTWPFRGHKGYLLEGGIRVPSIVRFPGRIRAGTSSAQMAATMDWYPTILDAVGGHPPPGQVLDGISLMPALMTEKTVPRALFWKFQGHVQRAVRAGNWKFYRLEENEFLYDLSVDTLERANRASAEPEIVAALKQQWEEWNNTMVSDESIPGFCERPADQALAMPHRPVSNCKPLRPLL
ncbi:MAG: sulfatase-like hydrolase/transferase [Sphingomonadaceae bacterium]